MRYFKDRTEAGKLLAEQITDRYSHKNTAVLVVSRSSLPVGAEIAKATHSSLFLLPADEILAPLLPKGSSLTAMHSKSVFNSFNEELINPEELDQELLAHLGDIQLDEYLGSIEVVGRQGRLSKELLKRHDIMIVSDGIASGLTLDIAIEYLKPIPTSQVIVAAPFCSNEHIEKVRNISDNHYFLDTVVGQYPVSHYYEAESQLNRDDSLALMSTISLGW